MIILGFLLVPSACSNRGEEKAFVYLKEVRAQHQNQNFDEAYTLLDSLAVLYPTAYNAKRSGELLRDSVRRDEYRMKIDEVSAQINYYKAELYALSGKQQTQIESLNLKIDSLEHLKNPYRKMIAQISNDEVRRAERSQCVTCIRN